MLISADQISTFPTYLEFFVFFVSDLGSFPLLLPSKVSQMDLTLEYEFELVVIVATSP